MARALRALVAAATRPQSPVRRAMTRARLVALLEEEGAATVETARRPLRFLTSRGPHLAAAASKFHAEEPETLAWIDGFRAGDVFWDIGAATGLFSLYAATLPGVAVWAFEPKGTSYGVLVEHLALNGLGEVVTALPIAFSDRTEVTRIGLHDLAPGGGDNAVQAASIPQTRGGGPFRQGVVAYTVDEFRHLFGVGAPDHLKIDVDGIEGAILRGAAETLPAVRTVMVEVEGDNLAGVAARIEAPLAAAGLAEDMAVRGAGSGKNRLYRRM